MSKPKPLTPVIHIMENKGKQHLHKKKASVDVLFFSFVIMSLVHDIIDMPNTETSTNATKIKEKLEEIFNLTSDNNTVSIFKNHLL